VNFRIDRESCVLVDTNVILEAHRTYCWSALTGGLRIETVEECVIETQTGFSRRRPGQTINNRQLQSTLAGVHQVSGEARAELAIRTQGIALDLGEESLWAHALVRDDAWILCSPDKASLRCGIRFRLREQLASLEALLRHIGHRPKRDLKRQYTEKWHRGEVSRLVVEEGAY